LTALIVGQISNVNINSSYRGEKYLTGDPVVVYGGLNPAVSSPIGATVEVGTVTTGFIQNMTLATEGYGYSLSPSASDTTTLPAGNAFTQISFTNVVGPSTPQAPQVIVGALDTKNTSNNTHIPITSLSSRQNWTINSISSLTLAQNLTFTSLSTAPMASVIVASKGGGLSQVPTFVPISEYNTDQRQPANLAALGILAPVQITNAGSGYANGANLIFIGGSGYGAYANIAVNSTGAITSTTYYANASYLDTEGGLGYNFSLPSVYVANTTTGTITTSTSSNVVTGSSTNFASQFVPGATVLTTNNIIIGTVQSVWNANTLYLTSNATTSVTSNSFYLGTAILSVNGTLGTGATVSATTSRIGAITSFNITDNGEDYVSAPNVALKVQDLVVTNVSPTLLPSAGDLIYQGANTNVASYIAYVDSIIGIQNANPPTNSIYQLRVYNWTSSPVATTALNNDSTGYHINLVPGISPTIQAKTTFGSDSRYDSANGVITYGDGQAKATASFLDGLVIGNGQYLDTTGQPSSFDVLQSTLYNNYTYEITLNTEISKYRDMLLNLLHPTGTQVIGRIAMESSGAFTYTNQDNVATANTVTTYGATPYMSYVPGPSSISSNTITFGVPTDLTQFPTGARIVYTYGTGPSDYVSSTIVANSLITMTVTLKDSYWTYVSNIATSAAHSGNNQILAVTNANTAVWNIINGGVYSNTANPLLDMVKVGDLAYIGGTAERITAIDAVNNLITVSSAFANANGTLSIGRRLLPTGSIYVYTTK
jgi:hypothetical protein